MTVIRLTESGKAVQVITDEGEVFQTSVNSVQFLLMGKAKGNFITTSRMIYNVAPDRFKPSQLYDPKGVFAGNAAKTLEPVTTGNDALSVKARASNESAKAYEDKPVWNQ